MSVAALLNGNGGEDDTYITYWSARALAEHGQILNYNGARIEQSSSLGLVIVLAALYRILPLSMPMVGYLTSMGLFAVTLAIAAAILRQAGYRRHPLVVPAIATVLNYSYWATSGMENTLVTASELWMICALAAIRERWDARRTLWALLATLAFVTARPESPIIAGCLLAGLALATLLACRGPVAWRSLSFGGLGRMVVVTVAAVCLTLAFRRMYFGAWIPNPAQMKTGGFDAKQGVSYLWDAFISNGPHLLAVYLVAIVALVARLVSRGTARPITVMLAGASAGHLMFIVLSGGDWMVGSRFLSFAVPSLVLASFLVGAPRLVSVAAVAVFSLANLICGLQLLHRGVEPRLPLWAASELRTRVRKQIGPSEFSPVEYGNRVHLRDTVTLTRFLPIVDQIVAAKHGRPVWVMTGQAGMMAYYLMSHHFGRTKLLDLWSLTTRELYDCFPKGSVSRGIAGSNIGEPAALARLEESGSACGVPVPDIYYNECLTQQMREVLATRGYVLLYEQVGTMRLGPIESFVPDTVGTCGHFAVRRELVDQLGLAPLATDDWNAISLR